MEEEVLKGKTLLVVDDESDLREILASELEFMGAQVHQAENIATAKKVLQDQKVELIISDIRMPGGTGIDLLDSIRSSSIYPPVLLITGFADITVEDAFDKGAEGLMNKPFKLDDLIKSAERFTRAPQKWFEDDEGAAERTLEVNFGISLKEALEAKECAIGRGGICFNFENASKRNDLNERVNFKFIFSDRTLSGVGIPRWLRHPEDSTKVQLGLEFVSLQGETLEFFLEQCHKTPECVAYIPKI